MNAMLFQDAAIGVYPVGLHRLASMRLERGLHLVAVGHASRPRQDLSAGLSRYGITTSEIAIVLWPTDFGVGR